MSTVPVSDAGLRHRAANDHVATKTELGKTRGRLAKNQIKAQQRFDKESGLEGQDRDGQFEAKQSTGTRAFDNAMEDGKRSAENFVDGVEPIQKKIARDDLSTLTTTQFCIYRSTLF